MGVVQNRVSGRILESLMNPLQIQCWFRGRCITLWTLKCRPQQRNMVDFECVLGPILREFWGT